MPAAPEPQPSSSNSHFANPGLAKIADHFETRKGADFFHSMLLELAAFFGVIIGALIFWLVSSLVVLLLSAYLANAGYKSGGVVLLQSAVITCTFFLSYKLLSKYFFTLRRKAKAERIDAGARLGKRTEDPILYLRSFADDKVANPKSRAMKTYEEDLALALSAAGPVVAVGKPREQVMPLGAVRVYLKSDRWQENVRSLASISQLVVIQAGTSAGVIWELEAVRENVHPKRVILSFLSWLHLDEQTRAAEYLEFCANVDDYMKRSPSPVTLRVPNRLDDTAFVVYNDEWAPEAVRISRWKKLLYSFSTSLLISETFRPALKERGIKLRRWKMIPYFLFLAFITFGVFRLLLEMTGYLPRVAGEEATGWNLIFRLGTTLFLFWLIPQIVLLPFRALKRLFRRLFAPPLPPTP